ncbi:uncharacterized protein DNG_01765 [Cephalotrichum gorgonifer]|uniref:Uncharacterized protein n=1 Tax=Cephalotrichum gorgonifer TaxID=2041049 RepID=A0AAE8SRX7_9PEZI|nr:uncharacterized protein DNG_01765 [Cephalotrichum gorgonifer]
MSVSPISPTGPVSSWQTPRRQVTFSENVEYYGGRDAAQAENDDTVIELGVIPKDTSAGEGERRAVEEEARSRRTICCLSRKTFVIVLVIAVFLLGALLGGVVATQIEKKAGEERSDQDATPTYADFPTMTHARPIPTTSVVP